jgi:uncharacterized protein YdiU (UPF0061 family)
VDHTLGFRRLADAALGDDKPLRALCRDAQAPTAWLSRWRGHLAETDAGRDPQAAAAARAQRLRQTNPWVIPRNHLVEEALAAASDHGDLGPFERLLDAVRRPYDDGPASTAYARPAPAAVTAGYRTFCGT